MLVSQVLTTLYVDHLLENDMVGRLLMNRVLVWEEHRGHTQELPYQLGLLASMLLYCRQPART